MLCELSKASPPDCCLWSGEVDVSSNTERTHRLIRVDVFFPSLRLLQGYLFLRRHYTTMPQQHDLGREDALLERPDGFQLHCLSTAVDMGVKHRTL